MKKKITNIFTYITKHKFMFSAILIIVALISVIAVIAYEEERKNILFTPYLSIDDKEISVLEYAYHYQNFKTDFLNEYSPYIANIKIEENSTLEATVMDEETGYTWGEYLANQTVQTMLETNFLYDLAKEANYKCENLDEEIEKELSNLRYTAAIKNISYNDYLSSTFIEKTKERDLKKIIKKIVIANNYKDVYLESINITEEEIEQYYTDNKNKYDVVDYRIFSFSILDEYLAIINEKSEQAAINNEEFEGIDDLTLSEIVLTEDYKIAKEKTLQKANEFYKKIYNEETFKKLCIEYAASETAREAYRNYDHSLKLGETYKLIATDTDEWLFDESREKNSTAIIFNETSHTYNIVYFIERHKNNTNYVSVKNIFIPYVSTDLVAFTFTDEDKLKTKTKAEEIIKEWESTSKTPETFQELVEKYNESVTSTGLNGEYSNLKKEEMPFAIGEWCYEPERKTGDVAVLNDESGYYIVYFEKTAEEQLKLKIKEDLREEKYVKNMQEIMNTHNIQLSK